MSDTVASPNAAINSPPSNPPRPLTDRIRRGSWTEPRVRTWWIGAVVLLLIAAGWTGWRLKESSRVRWLADEQNRHTVQAHVDAVNGLTHRNAKLFLREQGDVKLTFAMPDGRECTVEGKVRVPPDWKGEYIGARQENKIPLWVDKNDPNRWMLPQRIPTALDNFLVLAGLGPIAALLLILGLRQRSGILRVWRESPAVEAVVVDVRQTPTAPFSRLVRFVLKEGRDRRVQSVAVPVRAANLAPGDIFWLICPPNRPNQSIVAKVYE